MKLIIILLVSVFSLFAKAEDIYRSCEPNDYAILNTYLDMYFVLQPGRGSNFSVITGNVSRETAELLLVRVNEEIDKAFKKGFDQLAISDCMFSSHPWKGFSIQEYVFKYSDEKYYIMIQQEENTVKNVIIKVGKY